MTDEQLHELMEAHKHYSAAAEVFKSAHEEIKRLREALRIEQEEFAACCIDRKETQRERDEARREVCAFVSGRYSKDVVTLDRSAALEEAKQRGWDCFKEDNR